ncbi:hypothetical protein [Streptococcus sp. CSL10205-OR2]|uniref:hypothetical protein n=1 Tax=Streptococcus sp. CSL10205-OR2 TaxID=2980558 RepID=UPI0021D9DD24|nr:hypothetical protein [Streptococcus sp. CSL10205-OR2]MCU9533529.1 hypothetical protein [Streptococcus sp. CSL10205-OR2]
MKKKKYLIFIPLVLIIISFFGIILHRDEPLNGRYYLIKKNRSQHTEYLDKSIYIDIVDNKINFTSDEYRESATLNFEEKTFELNGEKMFYNYNTGEIIIIRDKNDPGTEYASKKSPFFSGYESGTVKYKD